MVIEKYIGYTLQNIIKGHTIRRYYICDFSVCQPNKVLTFRPRYILFIPFPKLP